jgi:putative two-component system response regulator
MKEQRGAHFDPACVDAFFMEWDEVLAIRNRFRDDT